MTSRERVLNAIEHESVDRVPYNFRAEVEEVEHLVRALGTDGGFILSGSHYYQIGIPVSNLEAISSAI